jgi:radical SAM protein with 4Fe4S-binding SPASM domain
LPRIPADLRKVLDEILRAEIFHVTLIGGEPTTSPALYPVCEELKRNHVYVKIVSNGTLIDRRMAETLAELGVNEVNVSVDGFTASENDPIRGAGTFERIRKGVRALLDAGLPRVALSVTAGSHNLGSLEGLPETCRRLFGVSEVFLTRMICSGEGRQSPGSRLSPEENSALRSWIDEEWAQRCPEVRVWTQRWHCDCARTRCVINPKGEMRACTFHGKNVANIDGGLLAAWRTAGDFDKVRRPYRYTEVCRDCEAQLTCKGTVCSARVFAADNRMISKECILSPGVVARYGE